MPPLVRASEICGFSESAASALTLRLHVFFQHTQAHLPSRQQAIALPPQMPAPELFLEFWKLVEEAVSARTLEGIDELRQLGGRFCREQDMDVVFVRLLHQNLRTEFLTDIVEDVFQSLDYRSIEYLPPILRHQHQMVV